MFSERVSCVLTPYPIEGAVWLRNGKDAPTLLCFQHQFESPRGGKILARRSIAGRSSQHRQDPRALFAHAFRPSCPWPPGPAPTPRSFRQGRETHPRVGPCHHLREPRVVRAARSLGGRWSPRSAARHHRSTSARGGK